MSHCGRCVPLALHAGDHGGQLLAAAALRLVWEQLLHELQHCHAEHVRIDQLQSLSLVIRDLYLLTAVHVVRQQLVPDAVGLRFVLLVQLVHDMPT